MKRVVLVTALTVAISVNVSAEQCEIDEVMATAFSEANAKSSALVDNALKKRDLEEESCLPSLSAINGLLSASIPDLSGIGKGLATKIRSLACKAIDDAISDAAENLNTTWEAPYGLGSVSGGLNSKEGGVTVSRTSALADNVNKQIVGTVDTVVDKSLGIIEKGIETETSGVTGVMNSDAADLEERWKQLNQRSIDALNNF